jgi:hypothetical protein
VVSLLLFKIYYTGDIYYMGNGILFLFSPFDKFLPFGSSCDGKMSNCNFVRFGKLLFLLF